ncbi:MAG: lasso peptide biosynthesis B2 protein [Bacillota bacterium]
MHKLKSTFTYLYLLFLLIIFDLELSHKGFNGTFRKYTTKYYKVKKNNLTIDKRIQEIEELFSKLDVICAWYPRKADCIHKTFLGYRIIRKKYSIPVNMVVGIRRFPFEAHAWLQCYQTNFFDDKEVTNRYKIILNSNNMIEGE